MVEERDTPRPLLDEYILSKFGHDMFLLLKKGRNVEYTRDVIVELSQRVKQADPNSEYAQSLAKMCIRACQFWVGFGGKVGEMNSLVSECERIING